jgi:hypothetical protein
MDFIQQLHIWIKGETMQGKVMVIIGTLLLVAIIFIIRSDNALLRGMLIPIIVITAINLGYGGYTLTTRPKTSVKMESQFRQNPKQTLEKEHARVEANCNGFNPFKKTWAIMIIVSAILFFIFRNDYFKGLSLGLTGMFLGTLLIDSFLQNRLKLYLIALQSLLDLQQ